MVQLTNCDMIYVDVEFSARYLYLVSKHVLYALTFNSDKPGSNLMQPIGPMHASKKIITWNIQ
jgi:hypothetical protein